MCRGYAPWTSIWLRKSITSWIQGKATGTYVHFDPVEDGGQWLRPALKYRVETGFGSISSLDSPFLLFKHGLKHCLYA